MERLNQLIKRIEVLEKKKPKDLDIDVLVIDAKKDNMIHVIQRCTFLFGKGTETRTDLDLWIEEGQNMVFIR